MQTTVRRVSFPDDRRILVISDLHAHAEDFRAVLKKAGFSRRDILVIVGDLIEKGPQSLETLRLVMRLQREYTVYPLMGNVDYWRLKSLTSRDPAVQRALWRSSLDGVSRWGGSLLHDFCREIGAAPDNDAEREALLPEIQRRFAAEIAWLSGLPTILDTQKMIFVHGGIPHERLDELEGGDPYPLLKWDDFYHAGKSFQKYVIVGHWPAVLYSRNVPDYRPLFDRERRIIFLDGACGVKSEGQLNLLAFADWRAEEYTLFTQDSLPAFTALEHQAPSPAREAAYISWSDRWVTVLSREGEMSRVMHRGREIAVPTVFLGQEDGRDYCQDTTDYVLPVEPGDEMKVILRLRRGVLAKKDSIAGWYFGRYEMKTEV